MFGRERVPPSRPYASRPHGALGRVKDDRLFSGRPQGLSLYGDLEVKAIVQVTFFFLPASSLVRPGSPFLHPDPQVSNTVARRGCQGWPSRGARHGHRHGQAMP